MGQFSRLISALQPEGTWRSPSCRSRERSEGAGLWLGTLPSQRQPEEKLQGSSPPGSLPMGQTDLEPEGMEAQGVG